MIVTGSVALAYYQKLDREPVDLDLVGTYDDAVKYANKVGARSFYPINSGNTFVIKTKDNKIIEIDIAWEGSRADKFAKFLSEEDGSCWYDWEKDWIVPEYNILYALKMSHRYLKNSPHFLKTMQDIKSMRKQGCSIPSWAWDWYLEREKDTYNYGLPKLNVSKEEFFDSSMTGVLQVFEHDDIHVAVALGDKPAYSYFKPDENEVMCDKDLFYSQPREIQLRSFVEEAMVLAIERSLVPFPGIKTPLEAFEMGMMKICTSIASGWWREAAWESYDEAVTLYDPTYVDKFQQGVYNGIVRLKDNTNV
jgi:hypothetical protein